MLDIKLIRDNPELVKEKLKLRGEDDKVIHRIQKIDSDRLEILHKLEKLKELRNKASDEIAVMKKNKLDASTAINQTRLLGDEIKELDSQIKNLETELEKELYYIPALPDESVPIGKNETECSYRKK